ncbi:HNH endonuclease [Salmonella enterica]|nr:HNH endonuclease [Salmonella enterica]
MWAVAILVLVCAITGYWQLLWGFLLLCGVISIWVALVTKFGKKPVIAQSGGLWEQINSKPDTNTAKTFYQSTEWRRLRYQALKLYGAKCACCGRSAKHGRVMHVDHIKPRSKYPELALEITNLQILCDECNVSKSNTDDIQWR